MTSQLEPKNYTTVQSTTDNKRKTKLISVGITPTGYISIGVVPMGVVAIGIVPMGVISFGTVAMGAIASGVVSMGMMAFGLETMSLLNLGRWQVGPVEIQSEPHNHQVMPQPLPLDTHQHH